MIRKQTYDASVVVKTTDYIGGFVYENGTLAYFGMSEGRVRNIGSAFKPEYFVKDQQGNPQYFGTGCIALRNRAAWQW